MKKQVSVTGKFLAAVEREGLLSDGDHVLVAVSGGADSVCLLDLLRLVTDRFRLKLSGFHMNHGLRPESSDDEAFVRRLFADSGINLHVARADVAGHARKHRLGIEESGRNLRYERMERLAGRLGCQRIALGHTANDNLETMLMNLARGTGPSGLAGIPVTRGRFIRPLLDIEREEIERHLGSRDIRWVEDSSNRDEQYHRNLLRHNAVTILKKVNPSAVGNARRTARLLAAESAFLESLATEAVRQVARVESGVVQIDTRKLGDYNDILKRRLLRQLMPELDSGAVEALLEFARRRVGGRLTASAGVQARLQRGTLYLRRPKENTEDA